MNARLKLAPPWVTYVNKLMALFQHDPEIKIEYDNELTEITFYVDNPKKAYALDWLLPHVKNFGNVQLLITVVPNNESIDSAEYPNVFNAAWFFGSAFENNPIFASIYSVDTLFNNQITYVIFKNRVVQFFNDNLNDIYGNISTLYQDIAEEIFDSSEINGVFFCTDIEEKVGKPLGEWP